MIPNHLRSTISSFLHVALGLPLPPVPYKLAINFNIPFCNCLHLHWSTDPTSLHHPTLPSSHPQSCHHAMSDDIPLHLARSAFPLIVAWQVLPMCLISIRSWPICIQCLFLYRSLSTLLRCERFTEARELPLCVLCAIATADDNTRASE